MYPPGTIFRCSECRKVEADLAEAREALEVLRGALAWHQEKLGHARAANDALRAELQQVREQLGPACGCDRPGGDACPLHAGVPS